MQQRTDYPKIVQTQPDPDAARIKGLSKDILAAHHAGDLALEIELVIALESLYFRNGREDEAKMCRVSLGQLIRWRELAACGITIVEVA